MSEILPTSDIQIFLNDPWPFLERPINVYQDAALLKGHEFDRRRAKAEMSPAIASLLFTRNPQVSLNFLTPISKSA